MRSIVFLSRSPRPDAVCEIGRTGVSAGSTTLEMQVDDQMTINRARETPPHTTREPLLLMIKADIGRAKASITLLGQRGSRAPATEEAYVVC